MTAFDLTQAAPEAISGASMTWHVRVAMASGLTEPSDIVKRLGEAGKKTSSATVERIMRRLSEREPS